jgi:putative DNA primase/helicase
MAMLKDEAQQITTEFVRIYPGANALGYKFRKDVAELYGYRAAELPSTMKGGYISQHTIDRGRILSGRVEVPLNNITDGEDLLKTLRHEVIGHYGSNTFRPADKRALLDSLIQSREAPGIRDLWQKVDRNYSGFPAQARAEEVFLFIVNLSLRHTT